MHSSFIASGIIAIGFLAIFISLGLGLFYLLVQHNSDICTFRSLAVRISLSILLFCGLLLAIYFGWITPGSPSL